VPLPIPAENPHSACEIVHHAAEITREPDNDWIGKIAQHVEQDAGAYMPCVGFDHTRVWADGHSRYAVTTEPYAGDLTHVDAAEWCAANGWQVHVFPPNIGMWNADGSHGTRLILASPPKNGVDIASMIPKLLEAMPVWGE